MEKIILNGVSYVPESRTCMNPENLKAVLIRTYSAGVHFGFLESEEFTPSGKVVVLKNSRRVWYWDGAASLSQMAVSGVSKPENCKFSVVVPRNEIVGVIETMDLTVESYQILSGVKEWKH